MICTIGDCASQHLAKGMCRKHYLRVYRHGSTSSLKPRHGLTNTPEYRSWSMMIDRCTNPNNKRYENYMGRGISVCREWLDVKQFVADMGKRPTPKHSIDRINNDGNYEPSNCRWATAEEQSNNRSTNVVLNFNGKAQTVKEWADELKVSPARVHSRLRMGWTVERALTEPKRVNGYQ